MHHEVCSGMWCSCSSSWIHDGASAPAFPAERLVVGDAVHPVGEERGADGGVGVGGAGAGTGAGALLKKMLIQRHDGNLHRLTVAAGHAHPLAPRRPRPDQSPPPPPFHRLASDPCGFLPLTDTYQNQQTLAKHRLSNVKQLMVSSSMDLITLVAPISCSLRGKLPATEKGRSWVIRINKAFQDTLRCRKNNGG